MPAQHIRGLGVAVVLVLCWLAWYNYEILLGESSLRLSWPLVRVEETQDVVGHGVGEDVVPPAQLEVSTATVMPTSTSTSLSPPAPTHSGGPAEGDSQDAVQGSQDGGKDSHILSPDEVLLIFKTGASTIWRRMPLHVTTTLSSTHFPNFVIYSDLAEDLSPSIHAIDALENVTSIIKAHDPDAYASYLEQQSPDHLNTYREHGRLPGDEPPDAKAGNTPGWLLDKYKFLPMLGHAAKEYPGMKWYIYIEDDTYLFLPTLLTWLSTQSHNSTPKYFGAYSGEGNDTFAQGGSGLVFSQSLMKTVFGGEKAANLEEYGNYTSKSCCGDVALGKVLRDYDIYVNEGDYGPVSFRPEPPWRTGFSELVWCSPVFTFHHLHQRDIAVLAGFEEEKRKENASRPLLFRDIFTRLIQPHISAKPRNGWDNFATLYTLTSPSPSSTNPPAIPTIPPMLLSSLSPTPPTNLTRLQQASSSPSSCQSACLSLPSCLSWRHEIVAAKTETEDENGVSKTPVTRPEERTCVLDNSVRLGREMDPQASWERKKEVVSGWAVERIEGMARDECVNVGNVVV